MAHPEVSKKPPTPMFFVGDTLIEGADIAGLNAAIASARKA